MPVRYQHQVGNQIIPLTPANLQQKPPPSSNVATTTTTASTVTTRASISVQCGNHLSPSDGLIQQPVGLTTQTLPKLSVVQPMLQTTGMTSVSAQSKSTGQPSSCEKGTSPLQVQVGICVRCYILHILMPLSYLIFRFYLTASVVLVVRVPGYRSRGLGSNPGATTISEKWWVWNGIHSALVSTIEEQLERKSGGSSLENREYSHRGSAMVTTQHPSIRKSWQ
jgi:hypothetical protein